MIAILVEIGITVGIVMVAVILVAVGSELANLPRHRRIHAEMDRVSAETDAYCARVRAETVAIRVETDRRVKAWRFEQQWGWHPDRSVANRPRGWQPQ